MQIKVFYTQNYGNIKKLRFYRNGKLVPIESNKVPFELIEVLLNIKNLKFY